MFWSNLLYSFPHLLPPTFWLDIYVKFKYILDSRNGARLRKDLSKQISGVIFSAFMY